MDESKYLAEVKGRLRREGFTVEMPEETVVTVSNLDELVQQSNQEELELGASQLGQEPSFMSSY